MQRSLPAYARVKQSRVPNAYDKTALRLEVGPVRPLRLEATYWSGPLLCTPVPDNWILGLANIVGVPRNFQLVRERIVDACLTGLPDCPPAGDPELTSIALSKMPVFFVVRPGHPLINQAQLSFDDIAQYPTLGLPPGSYPRVEACLKKLGFWNDHVRMFRYKRENWEGKTEAELTVEEVLVCPYL